MRFGIVIGVGQMRVAMMVQMRVPKPQIRDDQRQRRPGKTNVDRSPPGWMVVNSLMLKRPLKSDRDGRNRYGQPKRAFCV